MERGFHAEVYCTRLCVINILNILYILLCMARRSTADLWRILMVGYDFDVSPGERPYMSL